MTDWKRFLDEARSAWHAWDRDAELRTRVHSTWPMDTQCIARMSVYGQELELASNLAAAEKTENEKLTAAAVVRIRDAGEKSAEVAKDRALNDDEAVYLCRLAYRVMEGRVATLRKFLDREHDQLEAMRTRAADARAADQWQAKTQP